MIYKHAVSMSIDRREIVESHDDHVVIVEYLKPDPNGPFLVMSDYDEPTWAARKFKEPRAPDSAAAVKSVDSGKGDTGTSSNA